MIKNGNGCKRPFTTQQIMENNTESFGYKDSVVLIGVFLIVLLFCGVLFGLAIYGIDYVKTAFGSSDWNTTTGEISASYVDTTGSENTGFSYTAKVEYSYVVDDRRYESDRIGFGEPVQPLLADASAIIKPYEIGQPVTIYYNPDDMAYAVLEPGPTFNIIWPCAAGLVLLLFALRVIIAVFRE